MAPEPIAETAAEHLTSAVPRLAPECSAAEALTVLADGKFAELDPVYLVDVAGRLEGIVPLARLLAAPPTMTLRSILEPVPATAGPTMDQEHVALLAHNARLDSVPVVDEDGCFLGVVPPLALIDVLRREHVEDLHRLAGILRNHSGARDALVDPPFRNVARRLPWLLVGLVGSLVAALLVQRFEGTLEQEVAVAFFMPAIVYLADAIGTQTETMVVRALAAGPMMLGHLLLRELAVGATIGLVLAACAVPLVLALFARPGLALAVGVALLAAGTVATTIGLLFPWLLARAGRDPAYGSGPVATVVQDLLSLLIYFVCVRLLT
jgi:magnesium transporter